METEKLIELLKSSTPENIADLAFKLKEEGYIVDIDVENKKIYAGKDFRKKIRVKIADVGMNQKEISKLTGISETELSHYLTYRKGIPYKKLERLFAILDL